MQITDWCIARGLKVWFTQGLDIRLADSEIAKRLFEIRNHHMLSFAWDSMKDESAVTCFRHVKFNFFPYI